MESTAEWRTTCWSRRRVRSKPTRCAFVGFSPQHLVVGRIGGRFETVRGTVTVAEDRSASTVEASIGPASITTLNSVRDQDLRSEHLPDMERYLTAGYRSTATREPAGGAWLVTGDLTLHGVTGPWSCPCVSAAAADADGGVRIAFHANGFITRRDFGLTHELVKEAGGLLVGRDITVDIDAEAIRRL